MTFCWKVVSRLRERGTYGSALTSLVPAPKASARYHGPIVGPNRAASSAGSAPASSATVVTPASASFRAVRWPMPHSASVGRSAMTLTQLCRVSR